MGIRPSRIALNARKMPMLRLPGHARYAYSPIVKRKDYTWPGGKRLAFYIALNIEHFAFGAGLGMDPVRSGQQTTRNFAWRDYGNRIGNWRLFEILDELKLPATILLNSSVCYNYPDIVEKIKARGDDVVGHGRTNAELLRGMWEDDEARAIKECTEVIEKHVGVRPTGWMGPGAMESNVTPDLLKEAGYTHLLDWPVDDQPIWMQTRAGPLLSVPYPMELNDAGTLAHRDHTGREFADMIVDQFEEMLEQSARHPLVFSLALHGFIVGQPFRLRPLRQAMNRLRRRLVQATQQKLAHPRGISRHLLRRLARLFHPPFAHQHRNHHCTRPFRTIVLVEILFGERCFPYFKKRKRTGPPVVISRIDPHRCIAFFLCLIEQSGVTPRRIYASNLCTMCRAEEFDSFRRDQEAAVRLVEGRWPRAARHVRLVPHRGRGRLGRAAVLPDPGVALETVHLGFPLGRVSDAPGRRGGAVWGVRFGVRRRRRSSVGAWNRPGGRCIMTPKYPER
jgi:peptidoglycan/xylan/chitin deacetylase (PgdA/CDA1 family)